MKILRLLEELTGKKYSVLAVFATLKSLGVDSLTYVDLVVCLEKEWKFSAEEGELTEYYNCRIFKLRRKMLKRGK